MIAGMRKNLSWLRLTGFGILAMGALTPQRAEALIECEAIYCDGCAKSDPEDFYPPGTKIEIKIKCETDSAKTIYIWGPGPWNEFDGKDYAHGVLGKGTSAFAATMFQTGACLDPVNNCPQPWTDQIQFIFKSSGDNPCYVVNRETLGKNVMVSRGNNLKLASGDAHAEKCVKGVPTVAPDGNPVNSRGDGCGAVAANPVNIASGTMWHQQTDFIVKGRTERTRLELTRTYTANAATYSGGFGPNWRHNYESTLLKQYTPSGVFDLLWIDEWGSPYFFLRQADGTFLAPPGSRLKLTVYSDRYEVRQADSTKYIFTKTSEALPEKLIRILDKYGESLELAYDEDRQLTTVTSAFAGSITFHYNSLGQISEIHRNRDNLSYFYTYNARRRLISATDYQGRAHTFEYQKGVGYADGMLSTIIDPLGRALRFTYDENGRARQQYEPGGGVWDFTYGDKQTTVRAPNGEKTTHFFDENYREVKCSFPDSSGYEKKWAGGYLRAGRPEFGGTTKYDYDANGNVTSVQRPDDPSATQITYNQDFNVPTLVTPIVGAPIQFALDEDTGDVLGISRGGLSLSFARDAFGNLLSVNNGRATYADQRNSNGFLTQKFDLHNPETLGYDSRGRVISRQFLSGRTLAYTYDNEDRVLTITDSHGPSVSNSYDLMGKLLQRSVTAGGVSQVTSYQYDVRDRLISTTDALNRTTTFTYDILKVRDKPISITDPAGRITQFSYDRMDRLVKRTDALGAVTKFTYDKRGNLTSVTDANGGVTRYAYDLNDRKIRETRPSVAGTSPVERVQLYFYDAADRLVREITKSATGGADRAVVYDYDPLDRLVRKIVQREGASSTTVEDDSLFTYENQLDSTLLKTAVNGVVGLGFTNEAAPPFASSEFSVAATQSGNPLELIEGAFGITRDVTGEIASVSRDGDTLFTKTYDPAGRLTDVSAPGGFSSMIGYDGFGRKSSVVHSTGESGSFQHDLLNRVTQISWSGPTPISETLTYDPLTGNIVNIARENGAYTVAYDAVDQIVSSATTGLANYNRNWTYDLLGNRLQDSANGAGSFVNNFLTANGVSSFLSDPDGFGDVVKETSGAVVKNFGFRADGLLNAVQNGNTEVAYYFDALGRRTAKQVNLGGALFYQSYVHLLKSNRILLGRSGDGSITAYIDGNGIDEHLGQVKNGAGKGYVTDHIGSVLNGEVSGNSRAYGLFGESNSIALTATSDPVMYGFTGREWDTESGSNYHRRRNYNPLSGRWLSQDPIGYKSKDSNYYRYVSNQPQRFVDPTGLICETPEAAWWSPGQWFEDQIDKFTSPDYEEPGDSDPDPQPNPEPDPSLEKEKKCKDAQFRYGECSASGKSEETCNQRYGGDIDKYCSQ